MTYRNPRVLLLATVYFLAITGALANIYWIPTFIKRLSGLPNQAVTSLLIIPAVIGIGGSLMNAWHSDKAGERRWHTAVPLLAAGLMYGLAIITSHNVPAAISVLLLGSGFLYAYYPVFWSIPTMILSESAAAATFGLITSISQIGGFAGPYAVGLLNEKTHAVIAGFGFIALAYITAGILILRVRIVNPVATRPEVSDPLPEGEVTM